jgi:hypothetical protein
MALRFDITHPKRFISLSIRDWVFNSTEHGTQAVLVVAMMLASSWMSDIWGEVYAVFFELTMDINFRVHFRCQVHPPQNQGYCNAGHRTRSSFPALLRGSVVL